MAFVRYHGIVKKTQGRNGGGVASSGALKTLINSYLDERDKLDAFVHDDTYADGKSSLISTGSTPQVPGNDYKLDSFGRINLFGHLRNRCPRPDFLEEERCENDLFKLYDWWEESTKKRKVKATHFVFSIHPKTSKEMNDQGGDPHMILVNSVEEALSRFQSRFHPNDSIGALYGVHHDREHIHAHVLIHPLTSSGKKINLSHNAPVKIGGAQNRIDYQGFLKQQFNQVVYDHHYDLTSPQNYDPQQSGYVYASSFSAAFNRFIDEGGTLKDCDNTTFTHLESQRNSLLEFSNGFDLISANQNQSITETDKGSYQDLSIQCELAEKSCEEAAEEFDRLSVSLTSIQNLIRRDYTYHEKANCSQAAYFDKTTDSRQRKDLSSHESDTLDKIQKANAESNGTKRRIEEIHDDIESSNEVITARRADIAITSLALDDIGSFLRGESPSFCDRDKHIHEDIEFRNRSDSYIKDKITREKGNFHLRNTSSHRGFIKSKDANHLFDPTEISWKSKPQVKDKVLQAELDKSLKLETNWNIMAINPDTIITSNIFSL